MEWPAAVGACGTNNYMLMAIYLPPVAAWNHISMCTFSYLTFGRIVIAAT